MSLGSIIVELLAKTGSFETDIGRASKTAQKRMKEIETSAEKAGRLLGSALKSGALAAGAAIVSGLTVAGVAIQQSIKEMDELNETAQKIGIPVEVLSGLKYAGEQSGVAIEGLQTGLAKLIKFQRDAAEGGKESLRVFEAFDIEIKNLDGSLRGTEALLKDFSDVFQGLPDGPEKTALALQVFGKAGAELIPLLNAGSNGIQTMIDRARELGLVFDKDAGEKADAFGDKLGEIESAFKGIAIQVAIDLLPELIDLADWIKANYTEGAKLKETAEAIAGVVEFAGEKISQFSKSVQILTTAFAFGVEQASTYAEILQKISTLDFKGALAAQDRLGSNAGAFFDQLEDIRLGPVDSGMSGRGRGFARGLGGSRSTGSKNDYRSAAASLFTPTPKSPGKGKKDNSQEKALRDAEKAARDYQAALDDLNGVLREQAEITGGDLTKAAFDYQDVMVKIQETEDELIRLGKLDASTSAALAQARQQATEAYQKEVDTIQNAKTPAQEMLENLQDELALLGMTNIEREKAIALRNANATAASTEGQAISRAIDDLDNARRVAEGMDVLRHSTVTLFEDIASGAKSAKDILKDFFASIIDGITQLVANQLTQQLFGSFGSSGGGGFFSSLFGALFGGGSSGGGSIIDAFGGGYAKGGAFLQGSTIAFANGGIVDRPQYFPMSNGRRGLMGEAGAEAIVPLQRGPDGKLGIAMHGAAAGNTNITVNVSPTTDRRSAQQVAQRTSERLRIATARNT